MDSTPSSTPDLEDRETQLDFQQPFPFVLYRHGDGELMLPATLIGALLRHSAETFRSWRTTGRVPLDLETTARLYEGLLRYAADIDTAVAEADRNRLSDTDTTSRARADLLARELAELADTYLAADGT
ncbi:hypothetical protein Kpho02_60120 [Kitasatospora phosalacinea]|uniref:Uncharacterized protein n=1 Tax=Kitasatospora phosalacinea TaxID=2065 RepID=A0A9W6V2Z1_9ACTN|nr:hypothetical protein [Kitasatospora phosalacinea]GLW73714.1 hypothetical protein Kpho02_60120 [Kitasatospora phosalacinea]